MTAPVEHRAQHVLSTLRTEIIQGRLNPGEKLHELEISERLGVSRTPVREALQHLQQEGLVTVRPYRGAMVVKLSNEEVRELFEVREGVEGMAVRLATERMSQDQLKALERALRDHERTLERGEDVPPAIDLHDVILFECGNRYLNDIMHRLRGQVATLRTASVRRQQRRQASNAEHQEIVRFMLQRDSANAEIAMRAHVRRVFENLIEMRP